MATRKSWMDLLRDYWVSAGVGVLVGVLGTLVLVLPELIDETDQIARQQRRLGLIEQDISAYSRAIRTMYPLIGKEQLSKLFEGKGKSLIRVERGRTGNDSLVFAELRKSREGAYFIWCRTSLHSDYNGASRGFWLTRGEAMAWANSHATPNEFKRVFDDGGFQRFDRKIQVGLCG